MRRLLSLFDFSGTWSAPFWNAGWDVIQIDLKHGHDVSDFSCEHLVEEMGILDEGTIDGVILAPPCTEFTKTGAQFWDAKDKDGRTALAVQLVEQGLRTVEFLRPDFWALENPPGRLPKLVPFLTRCKRFDFDPCDFAGYIGTTDDEEDRLRAIAGAGTAGRFEDISKDDCLFTKYANRYTKRTALWGHFPDLVKDARPPIRVCPQGSWMMRLGGKSEATKASRSDTPAGFAQAFFQACDDYRLDWDAIDEGEASYPIFDEDDA